MDTVFANTTLFWICEFPRYLIIVSSCLSKPIHNCFGNSNFCTLGHVILRSDTISFYSYKPFFFLAVILYLTLLKSLRGPNKEFSAFFFPSQLILSYFGNLFRADGNAGDQKQLYFQFKQILSPLDFFLYCAWILNISFLSSFPLHWLYNRHPKQSQLPLSEVCLEISSVSFPHALNTCSIFQATAEGNLPIVLPPF